MSFKSAKVVMLPTNKKANKGELLLDPIKNTLTIVKESYNYNVLKPQHLYIISDDEIKEGDWFINIKQNCIYQNDIKNYNTNKLYLKKIIATTDKSLGLPNSNPNVIKGYLEIPLPQPSQSFIEKYVESYNNGKPIVDVMVEYEEFICKNNHYMSYQGVCSYPHCNEFNYPKLKVNSKDNTITIKKIKDSYSRDEVIELCKKIYDEIDMDVEEYDFENWIKQNL